MMFDLVNMFDHTFVPENQSWNKAWTIMTTSFLLLPTVHTIENRIKFPFQNRAQISEFGLLLYCLIS
jgi:hypothetical protein